METKHSSSKNLNYIANIIFDIVKRWQIILLVTVAFGLCYDAYQSISYVPLYCSNATFSVDAGLNTNESEGDVGETFTYIFSSNIFKKKIQSYLGDDHMDGYYQAELVNGTNKLNVRAYSTSPKLAYDMMHALVNHYQEVSSFVVGNTNIELLTEVSVPVAPCNPINHQRNIIFLGLIGFVLSIGMIGAITFLRNTIKDKSEIETKLHLHLLGSLPVETKLISLKGFKYKKSILINQYSTSFRYIESVKRIRARIERYQKNHQAQVLMVTSSLENEGKSSAIVNVALSFVQTHAKVLLIDGDFRKPSLHLILEQDQGNSLNDLLEKKSTFEECKVSYQENLDVLFGFEAMENIQEGLYSGAFKKLIEELRNQYDYILIDSAPSRFLSDSSIISSFVDGIILVVRQNFANVSTIQQTIDKLSLSKTPIIGCIHNQTWSDHLKNGYYNYRYGYQYHHRKES